MHLWLWFIYNIWHPIFRNYFVPRPVLVLKKRNKDTFRYKSHRETQTIMPIQRKTLDKGLESALGSRWWERVSKCLYEGGIPSERWCDMPDNGTNQTFAKKDWWCSLIIFILSKLSLERSWRKSEGLDFFHEAN